MLEADSSPIAKPRAGSNHTQGWAQKNNPLRRGPVTASCVKISPDDFRDLCVSNQKRRIAKSHNQSKGISKPQRQKQEHIKTLEYRIQRLELVLTAYFKYCRAAESSEVKASNDGLPNAKTDIEHRMALDGVGENKERSHDVEMEEQKGGQDEGEEEFEGYDGEEEGIEDEDDDDYEEEEEEDEDEDEDEEVEVEVKVEENVEVEGDVEDGRREKEMVKEGGEGNIFRVPALFF